MTDSYQLTALQLSFLYFSRKPLRKSYISFECISFMVEMLALDIICPLDCLRPPNTYHSLIKDASSSSCSLDTDARSCSLKSQVSYRLTSCIIHLINIWSGLVWSGLAAIHKIMKSLSQTISIHPYIHIHTISIHPYIHNIIYYVRFHD